MYQIIVRFLIAIMLAAFVQACASVGHDPNNGPNSERAQESEEMDQMLNPSPNGEEGP
jgi:hypothetical protein